MPDLLGTPRSIQTAGHEPALLQANAEPLRIDRSNYRGRHGRCPRHVYQPREHFSERQMSRMEYFQDFLLAFGVSDVMATPIDYSSNGRSLSACGDAELARENETSV
jgi:hypothetical protein